MLIIRMRAFFIGKMQYLCICSFDLMVALPVKDSRCAAFYKARAEESTTF